MTFRLLDRIEEVRPGTSARGWKLVGRDECEQGAFPPLLIVEALAQLGSWLMLASTDFKRRPVLGTLGKIEVLGDVRPGDRIDLEAQVEDASDESAVVHGTARVGEHAVLRVRDLLCAVMDADQLEPPEDTRRAWSWLQRVP